MKEINDGGPAFPFAATDGSNVHMQASGMTLRDWFAGQALMGFLSNTRMPTTLARDDAEYAYQIADAMIAARSAQ